MLDPDIQGLLATVLAGASEALPPDVSALREAAERTAALGGEIEAVAIVRDLLATGVRGRRVPVRLYRPGATGAAPLVLFAHGGGWVTGSLESHDRLCRMLSNRLGAAIVAVDYARAPEARYPAALDDIDAAWHWCREEARALGADPARMAVAGDSSGGNLATALALRLRSRREAQPALQLLFYPAVDARAAAASYDRYATGYNLTAAKMRWFWQAYAPGANLDDAELSPLVAAELAGLAPAVVASVPADVLRDEGLAYARRLAEAGVPTQVVECPGMIHGFARWSGAVPAARALIDTLCSAARPLLHAGPAGRS